LGEQDFLATLHLKQNSVVQFPQKLSHTKLTEAFDPLPQPLMTSYAIAQAQHPDHCLPSQARLQQSYITHPSQGPTKLQVKGVKLTPEENAGHRIGVSQAKWPPFGEVRELPRTAFHTEGGPKTVVWPPVLSDQYRSCQDLEAPKGHKPKVDNWTSSQANLVDPCLNSAFAPQKRNYNWPPDTAAALARRNSLPSAHKKQVELESVVDTTGHEVVGCYRPPPWCQFYRLNYGSKDDVEFQSMQAI